jgi:uncharacterized protein
MALGDYLKARGYGKAFIEWYLLPMAAAIWSCPASQMLEFPLSSFVTFCRNHGLLQVTNRPQWRTVKGGGREYVKKLAAGIGEIHLGQRSNRCARAAQDRTGQRQPVGPVRPGRAGLPQRPVERHPRSALPVAGAAAAADAVSAEPRGAAQRRQRAAAPPSLWSAWNYQSGQRRTERPAGGGALPDQPPAAAADRRRR